LGKDETPRDFVVRVMNGVLTIGDMEDLFVDTIVLLVETTTGNKHFAQLVNKLVMVVVGNLNGLWREKDGGDAPAEVFSKFITDAFNNRYLMYLQTELGGKRQ